MVIQAKNDTLDKLEVEKRKEYFSCQIHNNYLRKLMDKLLKDNDELEHVFLDVYRVTVKLFDYFLRVLEAVKH